MSGPYCKDCKHFYPWIHSDKGECTDPAKRIYSNRGGRQNTAPIVEPENMCSNWSPADEMISGRYTPTAKGG